MLPTAVSTPVRRVLAVSAVVWAVLARLPASIACWSSSLALSAASLMPAWARESVSLMERVLPAVSSSSLLRLSATGGNWLFTYFLRAKGLTRPQKPSLVSMASGALPVALFEAVAAGAAAAGVVVWASAGSANSAANRIATMRFFMCFLQGGEVWRTPPKASYGYDFRS